MPTRNLSKLGGLQILVRCCVCLCVLITNMHTPKRAASEPVSNNRCAFGFNMVTVLHLSLDFLHDAPHCSAARLVRMLVVCLSFLVLTWSLCFICLQNSCMMLLTVVPLIWFACLLFVFFSERFPFICRAGLCLGRCWANFCCYLQCFGHPDLKMKNAKVN